MATLLLAAAGSAVGGLLGATGAAIGQAAGALIGGAIDNWLFGDGGRQIGKLQSLDVQSSTEGLAVPRVYGRVRLSGQVIWATRFEEVSDANGGKGGQRVENFNYFANFAVGLCEGPIAHVGRVWANGDLLDLTDVTMRVHMGGEGQGADALISAKQGDTPAYRGLAYVVFERLPLASFGNAIPQLSFEVIRPVGRLENMIRGVTLIPGSTEFGYATTEVQRQIRRGTAVSENRLSTLAESDVEAALDELTAVLPNLESVALVVAWFGTDLRAGVCQLKPKVDSTTKVTTPLQWQVAGETRTTATLVSMVSGKPAFGGTPSDQTVVQLIQAIKARGLRVTFYPFIMMDVPAGNGLPDPYGGTGQPVYPWRGRITCHPAAGVSGTVDGTAAAASQVTSFIGTVTRSQYGVSGTTVTYSGPVEWSYRRMILHYAFLCKAAGGVSSFLIGSELRGLSTIRGAARSYPFVSAMKTLASDVRQVLGANCDLGYAADWSEWFGHQPASGDVAFHLDPLWADSNIDFVGIDAYLPLSDWRDGNHADSGSARNVHDLGYLRRNVTAGEGFDWYYASDTDRRNGLRTPITDGVEGKPWVYRYKDFVGWWSNYHYDRINGVEQASHSAWAPGLKPFRFTEIGCPSVDFGANEPNVFPDTVSSEGRSPVFSHGTRDDAMQRRYLDALISQFDPTDDAYTGGNPLSGLDGRRMVDWHNAHVWTWDARPYPWFPLAVDVWSDGANWGTGHWINGRMGGAPLAETFRDLLHEVGMTGVDTDRLSPVVDGIVLADRVRPRDLIEQLAGLFRFGMVEKGTSVAFLDRPMSVTRALVADDLVDDGKAASLEIRRRQDEDIPGEISVNFLDVDEDGRQASVTARRGEVRRVLDIALPVTASASVMQAALDALMKERDAGREMLEFALSPSELSLEPGDLLTIPRDGRTISCLIEKIEDGPTRRISARTIDVTGSPKARRPARRNRPPQSPVLAIAPEALVLDLPVRDAEPGYRPWIGATAVPWPGRMQVYRSQAGGYTDFVSLGKAAVIGTLMSPLSSGPVWRYDRLNAIDVELVSGSLVSITEDGMLAGGNLCAVGSLATGFEILQFQTAELIGERHYRLTRLLRGIGGSEALAATGQPANVDFVLLNAALVQMPVSEDQIGRAVDLRVMAAGRPMTDGVMTDLSVTPSGLGMMPLAPVHLRAKRDPASGDVAISWIRRTRLQGDDFEAVDVPLGEASESYVVRIHAGAVEKRSFSVGQPGVTYSSASQIADFGSLPASIDISVRQVSASRGEGAILREIRNV